jgi:hypothetical protein
MSAAKIWYKFEDAASPIVNYGTLGAARDLPWDATSDGQPTYQAAGLFGNCINWANFAKLSSRFALDSNDTALFGAADSIWTWITPVSGGAGMTQFVFGSNGNWYGGVNVLCFYLNTTLARVTVLSSWTAAGDNIATHSANGSITWGVPNLIGVSYDGNNLVISVNGVSQGTRNVPADTLKVLNNHNGWYAGCSKGYGAWPSYGKMHDAGFDNRVIGLPELLAMYNAGVP